MIIPPTWAVHVADGVLGGPMLAAGFAVAGALALVSCRRLSDDDVPRVALLTAAFFVASSIHVRVGPTSVHLLLNGLVGVALGWRAPLAILVGVTLQALLIGHGGVSTIGVNAVVQAVPALAGAGLFVLMRDPKSEWARRAVVAAGVGLFAACALAAGVVLLGRPWATLLHPTCVAAWAVAVAASLFVRSSPRAAAGAVVGLVGVVGALALLGAVLLLDGAEKWGVFASAAFLAHLPIAVVEALILATAVPFLWRVKPQLLGVPPV